MAGSISISLLAVLVACQVALVFVDCQNISSCSNTTVACDGGLLSLNNSDYIQLPNDTVLYNNQLLDIVCHEGNGVLSACVSNDTFACSTNIVILTVTHNTTEANSDILGFDINGRPLICHPKGHEYDGVAIITMICSSLSIIGSILVLLTYSIFKSLRTLPSLILMNLSAAILIVDIQLVAEAALPGSQQDSGLCFAAAVFTHYFTLAQLFWMSIMSIQLFRTFYQATKLMPVSRNRTKITFVVYFIIGWGAPLLIVMLTLIINFTVEDSVQYGGSTCWIENENYMIIFFSVPGTTCLLINFIFFIITSVFICRSAVASKKVNRQKNWVFFRLNIAVLSVTGISWVISFFLFFPWGNWAYYPFAFFNSTQGLVIFIAFVLTKRVLALYWNLFHCRISLESEGVSSSERKDSTATQRERIDSLTSV